MARRTSACACPLASVRRASDFSGTLGRMYSMQRSRSAASSRSNPPGPTSSVASMPLRAVDGGGETSISEASLVLSHDNCGAWLFQRQEAATG
eukprot:scaffold65067_cov67-Phaeocystis_antarctica.AAC.1